MGCRLILAPVACQLIALIQEPSSLEKISKVIYAVVIKAICVQRGFQMLQHYIEAGTCQSVDSVVIQHLACKCKRIALYHTHISECIKGIRCFVEKSAVTIHECALVVELDVSCQKLCCLVKAFVVIQLVGMHQMHTTVFV